MAQRRPRWQFRSYSSLQDDGSGSRTRPKTITVPLPDCSLDRNDSCVPTRCGPTLTLPTSSDTRMCGPFGRLSSSKSHTTTVTDDIDLFPTRKCWPAPRIRSWPNNNNSELPSDEENDDDSHRAMLYMRNYHPPAMGTAMTASSRRTTANKQTQQGRHLRARRGPRRRRLIAGPSNASSGISSSSINPNSTIKTDTATTGSVHLSHSFDTQDTTFSWQHESSTEEGSARSVSTTSTHQDDDSTTATHASASTTTSAAARRRQRRQRSSTQPPTKTIRWKDQKPSQDTTAATTTTTGDTTTTPALTTIHSFDYDPPVTCRVVVLLLMNNGRKAAHNFDFLHLEFRQDERVRVSDVMAQITHLSLGSPDYPVAKFSQGGSLFRPLQGLFWNGQELVSALAIQDYSLWDGQSVLVAIRQGHQSRQVLLDQSAKLLADKRLRHEIRKARVAGRSLRNLATSEQWKECRSTNDDDGATTTWHFGWQTDKKDADGNANEDGSDEDEEDEDSNDMLSPFDDVSLASVDDNDDDDLNNLRSSSDTDHGTTESLDSELSAAAWGDFFDGSLDDMKTTTTFEESLFRDANSTVVSSGTSSCRISSMAWVDPASPDAVTEFDTLGNFPFDHEVESSSLPPNAEKVPFDDLWDSEPFDVVTAGRDWKAIEC